ncbi:MAG TPA: acetyl-CoA decarbonylase/synthase complex subunit alpha/beta [Thermodesulfobacteriota bacterium]|nr:acetyl-CoA decarbonylase/synthase complex subunit alpha/beta [Thermodesulfobacteriota bacterium]HOC38073.1 acetyl-CoA decarbonylase/synthase complex subunit alpha/beta [Thermodesulfobacteriota bacterium]
MSKIIASAAIRGAHKIITRVEKKYQEVLQKYGPEQRIEFPDTAYYLPIIYGITGIAVKTLGDCQPVLRRCRAILPPPVREKAHLPYLAPALDAGMATLWAEEIEEAMRYLEQPDFYLRGEEVSDTNIWLGAADDVIMRKRGVEFVDGTAPGFAAVLGAAPTEEIAAQIAQELQLKNLYVFMGSDNNGVRMSEQLVRAGVQIGWNTRLVSFGPDVGATVFALGFATRAAMSFGSAKPGDFRKNLIYNKDRIFAFVLALGYVSDEWYANAAGAINFGFPVIADTPIPEILPTGICTYEHVVSNVPCSAMVQKAIEVRGLKVSVTEVPVPVAYGAAFEGERVRGDDIYLECGGGRTQMAEFSEMRPMNEIEDGKITIFGPDVKDVQPRSKLPLGIFIKVAGRQMQEDFLPILERQIHHLLNYAQGVMHIGQRDISWIRISKQAVEKGFTLAHLGKILHAMYHKDFGAIVDKVEVEIYTEESRVDELTAHSRQVFKERDERIADMTDEDEETFYSCTLCQSFAPSHVCIVTPERTGLCGAYNWLDCKASNEINPTGPNQPVKKGDCIDTRLGQWKGVNEFVRQASRQQVQEVSAYSIMTSPMTSCGCFECIAAVLDKCNGIMTVDRDSSIDTPSGMKFTTLAGQTGGGNVTPGFLGHSKHYITSKKFLMAEGGIKRLVWMPRSLKEALRDKLNERGSEEGFENLADRIADETIGCTQEEILPWLREKKHPALEMDPII